MTTWLTPDTSMPRAATSVATRTLILSSRNLVSAFSRVRDVRRTLTPQLVLDAGDSEIWLLDLGAGANRLGGGSLLQAFGRDGGDTPDLDDVFFALTGPTAPNQPTEPDQPNVPTEPDQHREDVR